MSERARACALARFPRRERYERRAFLVEIFAASGSREARTRTAKRSYMKSAIPLCLFLSFSNTLSSDLFSTSSRCLV